MMNSKKLLLSILFILAVFFVPQIHAADVDLIWNPNTEPDLAGYIIYQDKNGWTQIAIIPCGPGDASCCKYTVTGLVDGSYRWVARAFDDADNKSGYSDEAKIVIDGTAPGKPVNFSATVIIEEGPDQTMPPVGTND